MHSLSDELAALDPPTRARLERHGFKPARLLELARTLGDTGSNPNRVRGRVEHTRGDDVVALPARGSTDAERMTSRGLAALAAGECALVVMAGGMATRMGGVVKALVDALPGRRFLDLRLAEIDSIAARSGTRPPLWLMSSHSTHAALVDALGDRMTGDEVAVFSQDLSLRLTREGLLFRDSAGALGEHAPGHGDLPDALLRSGLLERFVARGGKLVTVANIDNLGATLDPLLIGFAIERQKPVVCEVVRKVQGDRGGIPARLDGRPIILEEFRLPPTFDAATVEVFNTNTFHFDASALFELRMPWTFFTVDKQVDGQSAIQFERLIGEVTEHLDSAFVEVPRTGPASRFLPVKDPAELQARQGEIEQVARDRGMLP